MESNRSMQIDAQRRAQDKVFTDHGLVAHIVGFVTEHKDKRSMRLVNKMIRDAVDRTVTSVDFFPDINEIESFVKAGKWDNIKKIKLILDNEWWINEEGIMTTDAITLLASRPWQKLRELQLDLSDDLEYDPYNDDFNQSLKSLLASDWNLTRLTLHSECLDAHQSSPACSQWISHLLKHMNWDLKELRLDFSSESTEYNETLPIYNALADACTKSLTGLTKLELTWNMWTDYRGLGLLAHARLEQLQHLMIKGYGGLDDAGFAAVPRISPVLEYLEVPSKGTLETIEAAKILATELPCIKVLKIRSKITNTAAVALFKNADWPLIEELMMYAIDDHLYHHPVPFEHPNDQALAAFSQCDWPHMKKLALGGFRLSKNGPGWEPLAKMTWHLLDTLNLSHSLGKSNFDVMTPEAFPMLQHLLLECSTPSPAVATALMNRPWKHLTRLGLPWDMFRSYSKYYSPELLDGFEAFANQLRLDSTVVDGFDEEAKAAYYERLSALQSTDKRLSRRLYANALTDVDAS